MFRAVKEALGSSRESTSSLGRAVDEIVHDLDSISTMPKPVRPLDFQNREYTIERIGARSRRDDVEVFEVHWTNTEVPRRFITLDQTGKPVVCCDGKQCEVASHTRVYSGHEETRLVVWEPSWLTRGEIRDLGHALESELNLQEPQTQPSTPDPTAGARAAIDGGEAAASTDAFQSSPASTNASGPRQAKVKMMKFQPEAGLAYTNGLRKLLRKGASGQLEQLLDMPKRRELIFRDRFVENGSFFNGWERKCRSGAALYITGHAQQTECEYCSKGNGPFNGCVLLRQFNKRACANCVYGGAAKKCNYHSECKSVSKGILNNI